MAIPWMNGSRTRSTSFLETSIATADGKTRDFWERNLRFKTDVSADGPQKGAPAIVPAGMMGDRADVIFASPDEISGFIAHQC